MNKMLYQFDNFFEGNSYPERKTLLLLSEYYYPTLKKYGGYLENYKSIIDLLKNQSCMSFYNAEELLYGFEKIKNLCSDKITDYLRNTTRVYNNVVKKHYKEISDKHVIDWKAPFGDESLGMIYQQILDKYEWNK